MHLLFQNFNWEKDNFPAEQRYHSVLVEANNVLSAKVIKDIWKLHKIIENLQEETYGTTWEKICSRIPSLLPDNGRKIQARNSSVEKISQKGLDDDYSLILNRSSYCDSLKDTRQSCLERSILEVWGFNETRIMNLTDEQILADIKQQTVSQIFGFATEFDKYLGDIVYDEDGNIVSASAAKHIWVTEVNQTAISEGLWVHDVGTGYKVDVIGMLYEKLFIEAIFNASKECESLTLYPNAASSFGRVSEESLSGDIVWISLGFVFMLLFTNFTIGKRNIVELRTSLSTAGIFGILQSIVITIGMCSFFGVFYSPVNSILPVLMIGLGVDDMFVIMEAWKHTEKVTPGIDLVERTALTMKQAGVAITVTSITDAVAFAVGATTSLPALRSFCIYAALGIISVYCMQITFFLVFLNLDERRIRDKRCDIIWCVKLSSWKPLPCSEKSILKLFFEKVYNPIIFSKSVRVLILLFSSVLLLASLWGASHLQQNFDHMNFLPQNSYLYKEHLLQEKYFPQDGNRALIYFSNATLPDDMVEIQNLLNSLKNLTYVTKVSEIFSKYMKFYENHPKFYNKSLNHATFIDSFSFYLNTKYGAIYKKDISFVGNLSCSEPLPPITKFRITLQLKDIKSPAQQKRARSKIRELIRSANISGFRTSIAKNYISWETNEIVAKELKTNLILVLIVIYLITLLLLASVKGALMVFGSVTATLICIGGLIWVWDVAVDTVSCIGIVLSVGLSVDYAVHVIHMFLSLKGSSPLERIKETTIRVGPAVFQGGFSTLIIFLMMSPSKSHVFITFFKIFVGSAIFGLYWGLIVLPVILSFDYKIPAFLHSKTSNPNSEGQELS